MNEAECIECFEETTALLKGHFLLSSGLHADRYVAKRRLYTHPLKVSMLCEEIAKHFQEDNIEAVVSPAVGGVALSQWVAYHLTKLLGRTILAVFAEKVGEGKKEFGFSEGCGDFLIGKRVLVIDDVLTTGISIEAVINAVTIAQGKVVGVGVLWTRGEEGKLNVPFFTLIRKQFPTWKPEVCPLCAENIHLNKLK